MGMFDFVRDAGAKIGIGDSTAEKKAAAAAKASAEKAAKAAQEQAAAAKAMKEAAARAKAAQDAAAKAAADKAVAEAKVRADAAKAAAIAAAAEAHAEATKSTALENYVTKLGLKVNNLDIRYDDGCAYISGACDTAADREKLVLAVGNVGEVNRVIEHITLPVKPAAPTALKMEAGAAHAADDDEPDFEIHTVERGDTLSKIAKKHYGDASKYPVIFEANKPMLKDPDEIFPGQALRIPKL